MKFSVSQTTTTRRGLWALGLLMTGGAILAQLFLPDRFQLQCRFHAWTGLPCPGCGASRCGALLLDGRLMEAFAMQPFFCFLAIILIPLLLYLGPALLFGWPLPRIHFENRHEKRRLITGIALVLLLNWIYLLLRQT